MFNLPSVIMAVGVSLLIVTGLAFPYFAVIAIVVYMILQERTKSNKKGN